MAQPLRAAGAVWEGRIAYLVRLAVNQILDRLVLVETEIGGRVESVGQVHAHRPKRSFVPNADARRLHHVIEILVVRLTIGERDMAKAGVNVAHVVKQNTADVLPE